MGRLNLLAERARAAANALPVLQQDALLYLLGAIFALAETHFAVSADYREWGLVAVGPYLGAAILCQAAQRVRDHHSPSAGDSGGGARRAVSEGPNTAPRFRHLVILLLLALVVVLPLSLEIVWRADAPLGRTNPHSAQAQPEIAVIERAGDRVFDFEDPYLAHPSTVGVSPSNDDRKVNATSFFPYLPGMVPFGVANAVSAPRELNDARVELAGFTLVVVVLALALAPATSRRRWRAFQFLVVLPTGALPMVTGGDDLPVLALLLLGLVLIARRHPVWAGIVMGIAGTLKWTAWPLLLLCVLCVRDEDGRPAVLRYSLATLAVVVPVVGAGMALGLHAFVENVVLFPLGLTKVHSPAASPLPGQVLVQLLPALKRPLTAGLVGTGVVAVVVQLVRRTPHDVSAAARFAAWSLAFATVIAPATRFGYFIYPANMLVWAYLLDHRAPGRRSAEAAEPTQVGATAEAASPQLASST